MGIVDIFISIRNRIFYELLRLLIVVLSGLGGTIYWRRDTLVEDGTMVYQMVKDYYMPPPPPPPEPEPEPEPDTTFVDDFVDFYFRNQDAFCTWYMAMWAKHYYIGYIPVVIGIAVLARYSLKFFDWVIFGFRDQVYVTILRARGVFVPEAAMPGSTFVKRDLPRCQIQVCLPGLLRDTHLGYAFAVNNFVVTASHVVERFEGTPLILKSQFKKEMWVVSFKRSTKFTDCCILHVGNDVLSRLQVSNGPLYVGDIPPVASGEAYGDEGRTRGAITKNATVIGGYTYEGTTKPGMSGCPIMVNSRILSVHHGVLQGYNHSTSVECLLEEFKLLLVGEAKSGKIQGFSRPDDYDDDVSQASEPIKSTLTDSQVAWTTKKVKETIKKQAKDPKGAANYDAMIGGASWADLADEYESKGFIMINGRKFVSANEPHSTLEKEGSLVNRTTAKTVTAMKCKLCSRVFQGEQSLNTHLEQKHGFKSTYTRLDLDPETLDWIDTLENGIVSNKARKTVSFADDATELVPETTLEIPDEDQSTPIEAPEVTFLDQPLSRRQRRKNLKKTSKLENEPQPSTSSHNEPTSNSISESSEKDLTKQATACSGQNLEKEQK